MRALVQRVRRGGVTVSGEVIAETGPGLLVLLGVAKGDSETDAAYLARKVSGLRVFDDEAGKMNRSVLDVGGEVLVVSQFTLLGDCRKGRRPSFERAALPAEARPLYQEFIARLKGCGVPVAQGKFQACMVVEIYNDGPVTLLLESK